MKHKIVLEIDGVRHKLIKTRTYDPCTKCSLNHTCARPTQMLCSICPTGTHFRKCKKGE